MKRFNQFQGNKNYKNQNFNKNNFHDNFGQTTYHNNDFNRGNYYYNYNDDYKNMNRNAYNSNYTRMDYSNYRDYYNFNNYNFTPQNTYNHQNEGYAQNSSKYNYRNQDSIHEEKNYRRPMNSKKEKKTQVPENKTPIVKKEREDRESTITKIDYNNFPNRKIILKSYLNHYSKYRKSNSIEKPISFKIEDKEENPRNNTMNDHLIDMIGNTNENNHIMAKEYLLKEDATNQEQFEHLIHLFNKELLYLQNKTKVLVSHEAHEISNSENKNEENSISSNYIEKKNFNQLQQEKITNDRLNLSCSSLQNSFSNPTNLISDYYNYKTSDSKDIKYFDDEYALKFGEAMKKEKTSPICSDFKKEKIETTNDAFEIELKKQEDGKIENNLNDSHTKKMELHSFYSDVFSSKKETGKKINSSIPKINDEKEEHNVSMNNFPFSNYNRYEYQLEGLKTSDTITDESIWYIILYDPKEIKIGPLKPFLVFIFLNTFITSYYNNNDFEELNKINKIPNIIDTTKKQYSVFGRILIEDSEADIHYTPGHAYELIGTKYCKEIYKKNKELQEQTQESQEQNKESQEQTQESQEQKNIKVVNNEIKKEYLDLKEIIEFGQSHEFSKHCLALNLNSNLLMPYRKILQNVKCDNPENNKFSLSSISNRNSLSIQSYSVPENLVIDLFEYSIQDQRIPYVGIREKFSTLYSILPCKQEIKSVIKFNEFFNINYSNTPPFLGKVFNSTLPYNSQKDFNLEAKINKFDLIYIQSNSKSKKKILVNPKFRSNF